MGFVILAIIVIAFIVVITNISVVQQSRAYVIERLARSTACGAWVCTSRSPSLTALPAESA